MRRLTHLGVQGYGSKYWSPSGGTVVVVVGAVPVEAAKLTRNEEPFVGISTDEVLTGVGIVHVGVSPAESTGGGLVGLINWLPKIL